MGVKYVRNAELKTSVTVDNGQDVFIYVEKIYPLQEIGNILDI